MEFLKEYLSEETYSKVSEELDGKDLKVADLSKGEYVSKAKYNGDLQAEQTKVTDYETQLATTKSELATAQADLEKAQNEINELKGAQAEFEKAKADYEEKIDTTEIKRTIDKSGARDTDIVFSQLDRSKITKTDKGYEGLTEQLESIKSSKSYLFGKNLGTAGSLEKSPSSTQDEKIRRAMGLPPKNGG